MNHRGHHRPGRLHSVIKVPLRTDDEKTSVKCWLRRMRRKDANFAERAPKARFGKTYVKLDVMTAIALMPWTDTRTSGDLDAHRFKKHVLAELRALVLKEKSPWWKNALTEAIDIIQSTPVGEYMDENCTLYPLPVPHLPQLL